MPAIELIENLEKKHQTKFQTLAMPHCEPYFIIFIVLYNYAYHHVVTI